MGRRLLFSLLCVAISTVHGWDWASWLMDIQPFESSHNEGNTLSFEQVSQMRVRDIKRRLTRTHGYRLEEVAKMIDKKDLIHVLAFEEHKVRAVQQEEFIRNMLIRTCLLAFLVAAVVWTRPIWTQVYEIAAVNVVVYTDRKLLEIRRCVETKSIRGGFGVTLMLVLDLLQIWLTVTVLLSWVVSRTTIGAWYFFPTPSIPVQPAQLMGGPIAQGPLGQYGINVGPMVITWILRFSHSQLEKFVGHALKQAQKARKKQQRANETPEERAARKAAKRKRKQEAAAAVAATAAATGQYNTAPHPFMHPVVTPPTPNLQEEETTMTKSTTTTTPATTKIPERTNIFTEDILPTNEPTIEERRASAAQAAERRIRQQQKQQQSMAPPPPTDSHTGLDELD